METDARKFRRLHAKFDGTMIRNNNHRNSFTGIDITPEGAKISFNSNCAVVKPITLHLNLRPVWSQWYLHHINPVIALVRMDIRHFSWDDGIAIVGGKFIEFNEGSREILTEYYQRIEDYNNRGRRTFK